jgi:hypothetical protein
VVRRHGVSVTEQQGVDTVVQPSAAGRQPRHFKIMLESSANIRAIIDAVRVSASPFQDHVGMIGRIC